ncbi:MAG: hypothetical protein KDD46_00100 [Bdellovibrionales bacterium]|nr:hypothetical protein [Bdellovibrionales bacterium]
MWVILLFLMGTSVFGATNEVLSPYGLGRFYEEPTEYRPSMKGATKFIARFTGMDKIASCMDQETFSKLITGAMLQHPLSPTLGDKGPSEYPEVSFEFTTPSFSHLKLSALVYLYLPKEVMADKMAKQVLSFQYAHTVFYDEKHCKENIQELIDAVIDIWMREYGFYNDEK